MPRALRCPKNWFLFLCQHSSSARVSICEVSCWTVCLQTSSFTTTLLLNSWWFMCNLKNQHPGVCSTCSFRGPQKCQGKRRMRQQREIVRKAKTKVKRTRRRKRKRRRKRRTKQRKPKTPKRRKARRPDLKWWWRRFFNTISTDWTAGLIVGCMFVCMCNYIYMHIHLLFGKCYLYIHVQHAYYMYWCTVFWSGDHWWSPLTLCYGNGSATSNAEGR